MSKARLALAFNGHMLEELAKNGVSKTTVTNFIARMEKEGHSCVDSILRYGTHEPLVPLARGVANEAAVGHIVDVLARSNSHQARPSFA